MSDTRIALYIGNELYPNQNSDPSGTVKILQQSPLTSPILGLLNKSAENAQQLVYNDATNPVFDTSGKYIGGSEWPGIISNLRGGSIQDLYLSFSTSGTQYLSDLISTNHAAARTIFLCIKHDLGFDGIDLDYEGEINKLSPIYPVANAAIQAGLKITAAPYAAKPDWSDWVLYVHNQGGTVSWLNLQCYAGGKGVNPGDWLDIGVPIVAGSCANCGGPSTTCSPSDMQSLFTLWRTGQGSVSKKCWWGVPNTQPQDIGGGFIWVYSAIKDKFADYMMAVQKGLGL